MWQSVSEILAKVVILSEYGRVREIRLDPFSQFTLLCACLADRATRRDGESARVARARGMGREGRSRAETREDESRPPRTPPGPGSRVASTTSWESGRESSHQ